MKFDLAAMVKRQRNPRRTVIPIRPIEPPAAFSTDLYREYYAPVIAAWNEAVPDIVATYARSLAEITTDSPADLRADIDRSEARAVGVVVTGRSMLERWAARFEAWHRRRWIANVLSATSVDLSTMLGPADMRETLGAVIERNVSLVRSVSDQARDRIADAVFRGLRERRPAAAVAKDIREAVAMGRRRAMRIAGDQASKLGGALNDERRRQAGIDSTRWVHSGKLHPREDHLARDGKYYTENPSRVGQEYKGKIIQKVPNDRASQLPFCGCAEAALLILE